MPYGNANDIVIQLANRVFPQIQEAPMIAGICGSDPTREMRPFLKQLIDCLLYTSGTHLGKQQKVAACDLFCYMF